VADAAVARVTARLSSQFFLRFAQLIGDTEGGNLIQALILHSIGAGNVGHLDNDPNYTGRFMALDDPLPDALRRPISILAVANSLGLPRETVRRHVNRLVEVGRCARVRGGVIAVLSGLRRPEDDEGILINVANVRHFVRALKRAGVVLD
jgi:hypothetical protein